MGWHEDVRTLALIDDATGEQLGTCLWDPWDRRGKMAGTVGFMDLIEADAPERCDGPFPPAVTMLVTMFPGRPTARAAHISASATPRSCSTSSATSSTSRSGRGGRSSSPMAGGARDWVEGPSFSIGFWSRAPEVIATYARHPETGEPVPAALVEGLALAQAIEDVPVRGEVPPAGSRRPRRPRPGAGRPRRGLAAGGRRQPCSRIRSARSGRSPCR